MKLETQAKTAANDLAERVKSMTSSHMEEIDALRKSRDADDVCARACVRIANKYALPTRISTHHLTLAPSSFPYPKALHLNPNRTISPHVKDSARALVSIL